MKPFSIATIGAGPTGLASALFLRRAGHRVLLFERFPELPPVGSGLMLQPIGMAVLIDPGLADRMLALGSRNDRLQGDDVKSGWTVLEVAYRNHQFGLGVHRTALFSVLYDVVIAAGITVQRGADVSSTQTTGSKASVSTAESREIEDFDLVIDASGANSRVRDREQLGATRKPLPYRAFRAMLDWCGDGFDPRALQQRYDKVSVMIGVLPIGQI